MPNPNQNIPYTYYQDIQIPDVTLKNQLANYFATGQYQAGINLLNQNQEQLETKAYVANVINQLIFGITYLETAYSNGSTVFLSNLTTEFNNLIAQFLNRGQYLATTQYAQFNFVVYNEEIYMCLQDPPVGTNPTNTTYWLEVGLRGNQGYAGTDVVMKYAWNQAINYETNDLVAYNGDLYVALRQNINSNPAQNSDDWLLFVTVPKGKIHVGITAPSGDALVDNTVWFQTETDPLQVEDGTGVNGTFQRYVASTMSWEPMYPNVLYSWVSDRNEYRTTQYETTAMIQIAEWGADFSWTYTSNRIEDNSIVTILPNGSMTIGQSEIYNNLTIEVDGTTHTMTLSLNKEIAPTESINIRIIIVT